MGTDAGQVIGQTCTPTVPQFFAGRRPLYCAKLG